MTNINIFCAGLRFVIATICLIIWMTGRRITLFVGHLKDGMIIGLLFGAEFGLLYMAIQYTTASSAWILLYTSPFFHAIKKTGVIPKDHPRFRS